MSQGTSLNVKHPRWATITFHCCFVPCRSLKVVFNRVWGTKIRSVSREQYIYAKPQLWGGGHLIIGRGKWKSLKGRALKLKYCRCLRVGKNNKEWHHWFTAVSPRPTEFNRNGLTGHIKPDVCKLLTLTIESHLKSTFSPHCAQINPGLIGYFVCLKRLIKLQVACFRDDSDWIVAAGQLLTCRTVIFHTSRLKIKRFFYFLFSFFFTAFCAKQKCPSACACNHSAPRGGCAEGRGAVKPLPPLSRCLHIRLLRIKDAAPWETVRFR